MISVLVRTLNYFDYKHMKPGLKAIVFTGRKAKNTGSILVYGPHQLYYRLNTERWNVFILF